MYLQECRWIKIMFLSLTMVQVKCRRALTFKFLCLEYYFKFSWGFRGMRSNHSLAVSSEQRKVWQPGLRFSHSRRSVWRWHSERNYPHWPLFLMQVSSMYWVKQSLLQIGAHFPLCACGASSTRGFWDYSTNASKPGLEVDEEHVKLGYHNWLDPAYWT